MPLIPTGSAIGICSALLKEFFGITSLKDLTGDCLSNIKLLRHLGIALIEKKIKSMSKKYISIPAEHLPCFPSIDGLACSDDEEDNGTTENQAPIAIYHEYSSYNKEEEKCEGCKSCGS